LSVGDDALLFVRPERVSLMNGGASDPDNRIDAEVERRDLEGSFVNLHLRAGDHPIAVHLTNAGSGRDVVSGSQRVSFQADDAVVMRAGDVARE
jgi:spermidine/putrescine transport system ATP-binding protein